MDSIPFFQFYNYEDEELKKVSKNYVSSSFIRYLVQVNNSLDALVALAKIISSKRSASKKPFLCGSRPMVAWPLSFY